MTSLSPPIVLEGGNIESLIKYVLDHHAAPSTLIICSTKKVFSDALDSEVSLKHAGDGEDQGNRNAGESVKPARPAERKWYARTLRLLSTSRTLQLVFCPDVTHLRAYLSTYSIHIARRGREDDAALTLPNALPVLAILNPIQLHRPTSTFSGQGLNRTFSAAVEAAHHSKSRLIVAECFTVRGHVSDLGHNPTNIETERPADPWDEDVSILNVTTKRLGELSVGRTVKLRTVAQRWCAFRKLDNI